MLKLVCSYNCHITDLNIYIETDTKYIIVIFINLKKIIHRFINGNIDLPNFEYYTLVYINGITSRGEQ